MVFKAIWTMLRQDVELLADLKKGVYQCDPVN
jgi:hypothetical protein